ncbi:MAG: hypothetical protein V3R25_02890, partial [Nitrosomonadaceae bacterium]
VMYVLVCVRLKRFPSLAQEEWFCTKQRQRIPFPIKPIVYTRVSLEIGYCITNTILLVGEWQSYNLVMMESQGWVMRLSLVTLVISAG